MTVRLLMCTAIVALAAAACGSDDAATVTEPASIETDDAAAADTSAGTAGDMPDLDMVSVYTGETVNLQSLVSGQTPLLLWFWAPH